MAKDVIRLAGLIVSLIISVGILNLLFGVVRQRENFQRPITRRAADPIEAQVQNRWSERFGKLPLRFEANLGQTDPEVNFVCRNGPYTLFLTANDAILKFQASDSRVPEHFNFSPISLNRQLSSAPSSVAPGQQSVVRMKFLGAARHPKTRGLDALPGKSHYFIGNDPTRWRTNVPAYGRIRYDDIYPGISLEMSAS